MTRLGMTAFDARRIVARLRPVTRGEQALRARPCVKAVDRHTAVLAASQNAKAQTVTCDCVIAPSEVPPTP